MKALGICLAEKFLAWPLEEIVEHAERVASKVMKKNWDIFGIFGTLYLLVEL
jgi:hypothetical protein